MSGRVDSKGTILVVSPGVLIPTLGGGAARTWGIVDHLRDSGYRVEIATANHGKHNADIEARVDKLWLNVPRSKSERLTPSSLKSEVRRIAEGAVRRLKRRLETPDAPQSILKRNRTPSIERLAAQAMCASRPVVVIAKYAWLARTLDYALPGTLRILDTIDVQHQRAGRAAARGGDLSHVVCTEEEERAELSRADILLAIQDEEAESFRQMCPALRTITAKHAYRIPETPPEPATGEELLFVGNRYDPNVMGLRQFLKHAWPKIRAARPQARLTVCGKVCADITSPPEGVSLAGTVPSLEPYYRRASVVINPVAYGTGLKIKTVEALAASKCLVCSEEGVRGLGDHADLPLAVADVKDGMAQRIVELLASPAERIDYERRAWEYAREHLSPAVVYRELDEAIDQHVKSTALDETGRS